uniref:Uncharacterized protein n=1 Tax=Panagrolaimus sp. ES5 TaxID=591445 RepID=A0AC34G5K0_9BILA
MKELERGVVSHFVAKFPQIKENVALVHQSYIIYTKKLKSTIYDLSTKFRELVPAIDQLATSTFALPPMESLSSRDAEYRAGQLLSQLIHEKANGAFSEYGRLVIDSTNSGEIHNALQKK